MLQARTSTMRYHFLILSLVTIVRGQTAANLNCTDIMNVQNLSLSSRTATSVSVSWSSPEKSSNCAQAISVAWCYKARQSPCPKICEATAKNSVTIPANSTGYNIADLLPCSNYTITIGVVKAGNTLSARSTIRLHTLHEIPGRVVTLKAQPLTCGSIHTEWKEPTTNPECVSKYELCWHGGSHNTETCRQVSFLDTKYDITGLEPSTTYNVTVKTVGSDGEKSEPSVVNSKTQAVMEIERLTLSSRTETSISLSWKNPEENFTCAQATSAMSVAWCYKKPKSPCPESCEPTPNNSVTVPANATGFNITNLLPCSNYTITVRVVTSGNVLSARKTIRVHTLYQNPTGVSELSEIIMGSVVMMNWEAPSLAETCKAGYQVCWEQQETASSVCNHTDTESFMIDDLPVCKLYQAYVMTVTTYGSLSAPTTFNLDLATPSQVNNLTVSKNSSNTVVVSWQPPVAYSECVVNYTLCHIEATGGNATCETISKEHTEHIITGLQPKTQYNITLIAVGPESKQSAARVTQVVIDASSGSGNTGSRLGSTYGFNSLLSYAVVILLIHRLLFSC